MVEPDAPEPAGRVTVCVAPPLVTLMDDAPVWEVAVEMS